MAGTYEALSPQYRVFRGNLYTIAASSEQVFPELLNKSLERKLLSDNDFKKLSSSPQNEFEKSAQLMDKILKKIDNDKKCYDAFLSVLLEFPELKDIAHDMKEELSSNLYQPQPKMVKILTQDMSASSFRSKPVLKCHQRNKKQNELQAAEVDHLKKTLSRYRETERNQKEFEAICKEQREELTQLKFQKKDVEVELDIARSQLKKALLEKKDLKEKMEQCLVDDDAVKQSKVEVPFVNGIREYTCDKDGGTLSHDDIEVTIPPGAIPDGMTAHIQMGVALHGPFEFSDGYQQVSPILWFWIKEDIELLLPLEFKVPHVLTDVTGIELTFSKADHKNYTICANKNRVFSFQPMTETITTDCGYGILSAKHCCYLCIEAKIDKNTLMRKGFCLHTLIEKNHSPHSNRIIHLCTYFINTCLTALEEFYPKKYYEYFNQQRFEFSEPEQCLSINATSEEGNSVKIIPETGNKIKLSEVDFIAANKDYEEMLEENIQKIYPPKIRFKIYSNTVPSTTVSFEVRGTNQDEKLSSMRVHREFD